MFGVTYVFVLSLIIILTEGGVSVHNPFYCHSQDPIKPQIGMFAIHSPYETIRGQSIDRNASTCNPSKFWMLSRHGTRLPNANELTNILEHNERLHREILSNYEQGRTSLCASDIDLLKNWRFDPNITFENVQHLTSAGWNEFEGLAQRYQAAFPSILPSTYSPNDYFFRTTGAHRTARSLHAFSDGLFGVDGHEQVQFEDVPEQDHVLSPYVNCPLYQQIIAIRQEQNGFREGPEYAEMSSQISAKLGFHGSHALRNSEVEMLFLICKYEQIFDLNSTSPFCAALSVANHQVYEYFWDLDIYYRVGYGHSNYRRLFANINCFLMQDMLRFLQSNGGNDHKARIFNSNMADSVLFLLNFGAFEGDIALTRHNFAQQSNRLWKSSQITPMGANLAVIRFE